MASASLALLFFHLFKEILSAFYKKEQFILITYFNIIMIPMKFINKFGLILGNQ